MSPCSATTMPLRVSPTAASGWSIQSIEFGSPATPQPWSPSSTQSAHARSNASLKLVLQPVICLTPEPPEVDEDEGCFGLVTAFERICPLSRSHDGLHSGDA
jgi:hypothetical protein